MTVFRFVQGAALALMAAAAAAVPSVAQTNFSSKTIEWVIPLSESGGAAKWANLFAPLLSEALPCNLTVVVKFMPGAGSTKGANWFQCQLHASTDGLLMSDTSGSTQFPNLLGNPRVRYEYKDWVLAMASGTGGGACLNVEDGNRFDGSANNLKSTTFIYGNQGATRQDLVPLLVWEMLSMKVEPVFGIKGCGEGRLMFERGQATIDCQPSSVYLGDPLDMVNEGKAVPAMTWGDPDGEPTQLEYPVFILSFSEVAPEGLSKTDNSVDSRYHMDNSYILTTLKNDNAVSLSSGFMRDDAKDVDAISIERETLTPAEITALNNQFDGYMYTAAVTSSNLHAHVSDKGIILVGAEIVAAMATV